MTKSFTILFVVLDHTLVYTRLSLCFSEILKRRMQCRLGCDKLSNPPPLPISRNVLFVKLEIPFYFIIKRTAHVSGMPCTLAVCDFPPDSSCFVSVQSLRLLDARQSIPADSECSKTRLNANPHTGRQIWWSQRALMNILPLWEIITNFLISRLTVGKHWRAVHNQQPHLVRWAEHF